MYGLAHKRVADAISYIGNAFFSQKAQVNAATQNFNPQAGTHVGNGAAGNVQAPAIGTGTGPSNPHNIVGFKKVVSEGVTYYTPLFK